MNKSISGIRKTADGGVRGRRRNSASNIIIQTGVSSNMGKEGILNKVTEDKRKEHLSSGQIRASQLGIES